MQLWKSKKYIIVDALFLYYHSSIQWPFLYYIEYFLH